MRYLLEAELLIKTSTNDFEINRYELTYLVENIPTGKYSNIKLEDNALTTKPNELPITSILEIEIDNIYMELDRSLMKSEDFFRRTIYRYDWMRCRVNQNSGIISIDNIQEMIESWSDIKKLLLKDYTGSTVTKYIESIDNQMLHLDFNAVPMSQYFYFGLIFPLIPANHDSAWLGHRTVVLSDFDKYLFEELITPISDDSQMRRYSISGKAINPDIIKLKKYQGNINMYTDNIYPICANIEVEYVKEDVDISWNFKLNNY